MMLSHHQPVCEVDFLVRAKAVSGEELVIRRSVDCECAAAVIEADNVLRVDLLGVACLNPAS
jgi:hypothetical protein